MGNHVTELGVYILGAVALLILAAAGIYANNQAVVTCAVLASGAAYVSQMCGAMVTAGHAVRLASIGNAFGMLVSLLCWLAGTLLL